MIGLTPCGCGLLPEVVGAEDVAVVGHRQGRHAHPAGLGEQVVDAGPRRRAWSTRCARAGARTSRWIPCWEVPPVLPGSGVNGPESRSAGRQFRACRAGPQPPRRVAPRTKIVCDVGGPDTPVVPACRGPVRRIRSLRHGVGASHQVVIPSSAVPAGWSTEGLGRPRLVRLRRQALRDARSVRAELGPGAARLRRHQRPAGRCPAPGAVRRAARRLGGPCLDGRHGG